MSEANKALVQRLVGELQDQHKLDVIGTFFAADFVNHTPPRVFRTHWRA